MKTASHFVVEDTSNANEKASCLPNTASLDLLVRRRRFAMNERQDSAAARTLVSASECSSPRQQESSSSISNGDTSSLTEGAEMTDQSSSSRGSCQVNDAFPDGDEKDPNSREVRKLLRVMANRRSARESRDRRKKLVADLQEKVANLAEVNAKILESNQAMRRELVDLLQEAGISLPAAALSI